MRIARRLHVHVLGALLLLVSPSTLPAADTPASPPVAMRPAVPGDLVRLTAVDSLEVPGLFRIDRTSAAGAVFLLEDTQTFSVSAAEYWEHTRHPELTVYLHLTPGGAFHYHRVGCPLLIGRTRATSLRSVGARRPCGVCEPPPKDEAVAAPGTAGREVRDEGALSLLRPGTRLSGRLLAVDDEILVVVLGKATAVRVPRRAIARIEVRAPSGGWQASR